ncbi:MAG: hypothetical protein ACI9KS_001770 [Sulfitobacter sp.]|jgi:hypothetical protein
MQGLLSGRTSEGHARFRGEYDQTTRLGGFNKDYKAAHTKMHAPDPHSLAASPDVSKSGGGKDPRLQATLSEGSLALAFTLPDLRPDLMGIYGAGSHWANPGGVFGLWVSPRGALVLRHRTGAGSQVWEGPSEFCGAGDRVRLSYQVWQPMGYGVLRAENGTTGAVLEARLENPQPLPLANGWTDLPPEHAPTVEVAAQPIPARGLNAFAFGTHLPTPHGPFLVEQLLPGDTIQTPSGPVILRDMWLEPMTDVQRQEAITLRTPYFGLTQTITVLPDQRFLLSSVEVQSLTGQPEMLVAARDLVIGRAGHPDWSGVGPMIHLSFDETVVLPMGGLSLVCPATVLPEHGGTIVPGPGDIPWSGGKEARAVIEALARRKGIMQDGTVGQR